MSFLIGGIKPEMLAIGRALRASSAPIRGQLRLSSASALAAARWSGGAPLDGATWSAPADAGAAYALAAEVDGLSGGRPLIGLKVGATNAKTMEVLGLDAPFWGRLYTALRSDGARAAFAVSTPRDGRGALSVECEWALSLARDLPAGGTYTEDEVAAAVASVHACIEVCGTRFGASAQPAAPAGRAIIADHAGNETIAVTGALPCDVRALAEHEVVCTIAGAEKGRGDAQLVLGSPLTSLTWLANNNTHGLRAGMLVPTGTMTGKHPVEAGDICVGTYGDGLAEISITFE